jgi:hypothetical protein
MSLSMIFVIATGFQYLQMFLIVLGIVVFSQIFNLVFGLKFSQQMENQQRIREIQEEILNPQNSPEEIQRLQAESMKIMSETLKKNLIPSCVRCGIFLIIFWVLGLFYSEVDFLGQGSGYYGIYLLFSLGLSFIIYGIKRIWKKIRSEGTVEEPFMDVANALRGPRFITSQTSSLNYQDNKQLSEMKKNLEGKIQRGELPADLDINAEIERMDEENLISEASSLDEAKTSDSKEEGEKTQDTWKKRISQDENSEPVDE